MASLGTLTVTLDRETAVAALVAIRDMATGVLADPSSDRGDTLADIRRVAQEALDQCRFQRRPQEVYFRKTPITQEMRRAFVEALKECLPSIPLTQEERDDWMAVLSYPASRRLTLTSGAPLKPTDPQASVTYVGYGPRVQATVAHFPTVSLTQEMRDDCVLPPDLAQRAFQREFAVTLSEDCYTGIARAIPGPGCGDNRLSDEPPADTPQIVENKSHAGTL